MNEATRDAVSRFFEAKLTECKKEIAALHADGRADEAVFARVRMNVYGIFSTVFSAGCRTAGENAAAFFLDRLQQIPQSWQASLEKAEQHADTQKVYIEHIKLETAGQIRQTVGKLLEEAL